MIYGTRLSGYELARINNGLKSSPERDDRYPEHAQWIPQYKTEAVLLEKVQELAPVQIRFNTRFASAQQDEKGVAIRVVSKDDHEQTLQARYLIGADGVRSMVLHPIGAKLEGSDGVPHHPNIILPPPRP